MTVESREAGALPRPGPIGRGVRLALGIGVLYFLAGLVSDFAELTDGVDLANPFTWAGLAYSLYEMPELVGLVFSRRWPARTVRLLTGGGLVLAASTDLALTGDPNGGAFGITFGLMLGSVLGILGVSLLVAAAAAAPG